MVAGRMPSGAGDSADATLTSYLMADRGAATRIVAVTSAIRTGQIELAPGTPVILLDYGGSGTSTLYDCTGTVSSGG